MKHIYIAGKYRGKNEWQIRQNILAAEKAGAEIIKAGHIPIIPHRLFQHYHGVADQEWIMNACLSVLKKCDYIYPIPGWTESEGARKEMVFARGLGIKVLEL